MYQDIENAIQEVIENLVYKLYPAIQHQFILITSTNDLVNQGSSSYRRIYELLSGLKSEFQSLTTYENKLVFPAVLKNKPVTCSSMQQANIEDLFQLTKGKEHRLLQLANELSSEVQKSDFDKCNNPITELIRLFKNDFAEQKSKWNKLIVNSLNQKSLS